MYWISPKLVVIQRMPSSMAISLMTFLNMPSRKKTGVTFSPFFFGETFPLAVFIQQQSTVGLPETEGYDAIVTHVNRQSHHIFFGEFQEFPLVLLHHHQKSFRAGEIERSVFPFTNVMDLYLLLYATTTENRYNGPKHLCRQVLKKTPTYFLWNL